MIIRQHGIDTTQKVVSIINDILDKDAYMDLFKNNYLLFKRTKQCYYTSILYFLIWFLIIFYSCISDYLINKNMADVVGVLDISMEFQIFSFIIFTFVSYEYFTQTSYHSADEFLSCLKISRNKQVNVQIVWMMIFNIIYFLANIFVNILFNLLIKNINVEYFLYIFKLYFIYILCLNTIAILIGRILSFIKNRLYSYILLIVVVFVATIKCAQLFYSVDKISKISDLTQIFCVSSLYGTNYSYFYPVDIHFISKSLFWIFILITIICIINAKSKIKEKLIYLSVLLPLTVVMFTFWNKDTSGCYNGYDITTGELYTIDSTNTNVADFYVLKYYIDLKIDTGLEAFVQMDLSDSSLESYEMTLYSGYTIIDMYDQNGDILTYNRDGNYVSIYNKNKNLSKIYIMYEGSGTNKYYSNNQGVYFQGNFPFYPIVGKCNIYTTGLCELERVNSEFEVNVEYSKIVYSNLDTVYGNHFSGNSNNLTLVSGFWEEKNINGIDYIYPCISSYYNPNVNTYLTDGISYYIDNKVEESIIDYSIKDKKIIIAPFGFEGGNYMFGTDSIILETKADLDIYYVNYLTTGDWYYHDEPTKELIDSIVEENE